MYSFKRLMSEELVTTIVAQRHHAAVAPRHRVEESTLGAVYCCLAYHINNLF